MMFGKFVIVVVSVTSPRSDSAIGFVNQHRVLSLMEGLCRTADTFNAGIIVGALRIVCNGLCTASRFHTAEENLGCLLGCHEGLRYIRHYNRCPTFSIPYVPCGLTPTNARCPRRFSNDLLFKIAVRSDRLCILVAVLLDAFATAPNRQIVYFGCPSHFSLSSQLTTYRESTVDRVSTFVSLCLGKS